MKKISENEKSRKLILFQIILLVTSIIAVGYIVGSEFRIVSAQTTNRSATNQVGTGQPRPSVTSGSPTSIGISPERAAEILFGEVGVENPTPEIGDNVPSEIDEELSTWDKIKNFGEGGTLRDAGIAIGIGYASKKLAESAGVDTGDSNKLGTIVAVTAFVGEVVGTALGCSICGRIAGTVVGWALGWALGLFTSEAYFILGYQCYPWSPPSGGENCELCNQGEFPCSEYQCRSLGASCELINEGTNEQLCSWKNRNDILPPEIRAWEDVLSPDYVYSPDNTVSPPDRAVTINKQSSGVGGSTCVEPYFPLEFGVTLNKPARCKIDEIRGDSFEEMPDRFITGTPYYLYNHSLRLSLPSPSAATAENITLRNGGDMNLYVRCETPNGYSNIGTFEINFCVDDGPDNTQPEIVDTSIENGRPIAFDQSSVVDLGVYINEPAECRWSKLDKDYDDMENQMACRTGVTDINTRQLYTCSTTLTGLKNQVENDFYFRCEDQPHLKGTEDESNRNKNSQSYRYSLLGTQPLVLNELGPNKTIRDSTSVVKVTLTAETSAGAEEGNAFCYFSETGEQRDEVQFFYPDRKRNHQHEQDLYLIEGDYTYYINCVDAGGNADNGTVSFSVESDNDAPVVVRVYNEDQKLQIITNEDAECVYSNNDCNYPFDEGLVMSSLDDRKHSIKWDPNRNFYIKCGDEFLNQPLPDQCSIIARPFRIK